MKKCFKVGIFATLGLMLCSLGLASKGGVVETAAAGLATYASFSRASSTDSVTGGVFSHTTGMREFTDSYGEYGAGTKGDGSIVYMQILSSTAYLSDAPASGDLVITSKLSSDGTVGIRDNVYGVLLKQSGEELGDPVLLTSYIPSDGNAKEYSIRINVEECFSQVYGVKVYKTRTATSGVDALYYSMYLSAGGAKVKLDTGDFKMPIGEFSKTIKATPVLMVEPYTYSWEVTEGETVSITSGATADTITIKTAADGSGASKIRCTVVDSSVSPLTLYAEVVVTATPPNTVDWMLDHWTDDQYNFVKGYIVSENLKEGGYQFHFASESRAVYTNEADKTYTCVDLVNGTASTVKKGDYLVIGGTTGTVDGVKQFVDGYTIYSTTRTAQILSDYICGSSVEDQCMVKYPVCKALYESLSVEEQVAFAGDKYTTAYNRYMAWSVAYETPAPSPTNSSNNISGNVAIIISIAVAILGLTAAGTILVIKKKKENF